MRMKLGELLVKANLVTPQQVQEGLNHQKRNGGRLGRALVALGYVKDEQILDLLSRRFGMPQIKLADLPVDPAILAVLPAEMAWRHRILPLSRSGATLTLAVADPTNVAALEGVRNSTGYRVEPVVAGESAIEAALGRYYGPEPPGRRPEASDLTPDDLSSLCLSEVDLDSASELDANGAAFDEHEIDIGQLSRSADVDPVVKLAYVILIDALKRGASDIHIEPYEKEYRVRLRIDGILFNSMALPLKLREPLTSRLKTMARLDVREKRIPQQGSILVRLKDADRSRQLGFRVSTLPTLWGEKVVLRLQDEAHISLELPRLGLDPGPLDRLHSALRGSRGLIIVAGPLGSGRTTTLYAALAACNRPDVSIVTIEAAVALPVPGINQVAARLDPKRVVPAALPSFLAQDTNVVALDGLGDDDDAEAAVSLAARSGLLVFATLMEADAASAVETLARASGKPSDLEGALRLVVAQRLVRRTCGGCKVDVTAETPSSALVDAGFATEVAGTFPLYAGRGCKACHGTGYRGQVGLFEVMEVGDGGRDLIRVGAKAAEIRKLVREGGIHTLRVSGLEKVKQGITTVAEVTRVAGA